MPELMISERFCGPPGSANGGYICGRLAGFLPDAEAVTVTLKSPPPLRQPMRVMLTGDATLTLHDAGGMQLIAEAQTTRLALPVPQPPSLAQAEATRERYSGFDEHPFPGCFVCGPQRGAGDGLRIFAGPLPDADMVAAVWRPDSGLADSDGRVRAEYVWAALDCPGAFAAVGIRQASWPVLLGRLTAQITMRPLAGAACIVVAWPLAQEGRKYHTGSALFNAGGDVLAKAQAVWIEPRR